MRITKESIVVNPAASRHAARIVALGTTAAIAFTAFGATAANADEQHKVSRGDTVGDLALRYGSTIDAIIAANRLNSHATIFAGTTISIPTVSKSGSSTSTKKSSTTASTGVSSGTHTVKSGDTVWDLARKYDTTVSSIIKNNGLNKSAVIHAGQKLSIPGAGGATTTSSASTSPAKSTGKTSASVGSHKVSPGDTVWDLARKYGTSVPAIIKANGLGQSASIRIGQMLSIPGAKAATATATTVSNVKTGSTSSGAPKLATDKNLDEFGGTSVNYTVKSGDTLSKIASAHSVSVNSIVSANGIKNASSIAVGQKLTIPGGIPTGLVGDSFLGRTYSAPVVGAANQNKATLQAMDVPSKAQMQSLIISTAKKMGVDPALAQAVAYQESGFNMRAVSPANAIGVMQVIPSSGQWASDLVGRDLNLLVPEDNVTAGVAILKKLQRNGVSLENAIGGYYQGETAVRKYGLYSDTKRYVASVLSLKARFQ
jgi:LysM repeat protein